MAIPEDPSPRDGIVILSGEKGNTVPWAIAHASYKRQRRNPGITEFEEMPDRGHALTIDSGWREVADVVLAFVKKHHPARRQDTSRERVLDLRGQESRQPRP